MLDIGVSADPDLWVSEGAGFLDAPPLQAEGLRRKFLMEHIAFRDKQVVHTRRKRFGNVRDVDFRGLRNRRSSLKLSLFKESALVGVQAGDVITGDIARHWKGGQGQCEHCQLEKHTLEHQWWRCPRFQGIRNVQCGDWNPRLLEQELAPATKRLGLPTLCDAAVKRREDQGSPRHR